MGCQQIDQMMSLKLDGLLSAEEDLQFHEHVAGCTLCRSTWEAMQFADALLCASALEPLPVPVGFTAKVMQRVAVTVVQRPVAVPVAGPALALPSVLPPH